MTRTTLASIEDFDPVAVNLSPFMPDVDEYVSDVASELGKTDDEGEEGSSGNAYMAVWLYGKGGMTPSTSPTSTVLSCSLASPSDVYGVEGKNSSTSGRDYSRCPQSESSISTKSTASIASGDGSHGSRTNKNIAHVVRSKKNNNNNTIEHVSARTTMIRRTGRIMKTLFSPHWLLGSLPWYPFQQCATSRSRSASIRKACVESAKGKKVEVVPGEEVVDKEGKEEVLLDESGLGDDMPKLPMSSAMQITTSTGIIQPL